MDAKTQRDIDKQMKKRLDEEEFECIYCGQVKKYKNMTQVIESESRKSEGVACKNCDEEPE